MNDSYLKKMDEAELEAYAGTMGFSVKAGGSRDEKVAIIRRKRERVAELTVLGVPIRVPVKRAHDKRVTDLISKRDRSDEETVELFRLLVGEEGWEELLAAATEEDGTVDNDALAYALRTVLFSRELKNY